MADGGDTEPIDWQPQPSPPSGDDSEKEWQETVPFDDTVVMDSPLIDCTQLVNLDSEAGLVDEKEIVLDSEDESVNGIGREANGYVLNLRKRRLSTSCEQVEDLPEGFDACAGKERLSTDFVSANGSNDPIYGSARLNCFGSDESGNASQANALEFVEQFVSLNNVDSYEGVGSGKMIKNSFPVSWAKGLQSLAKRLGNQTGTFEWVDNDEHEASGDFVQKRIEVSVQHGENEQSSGSMHQEDIDLGKIGGRSSDIECGNEKKIASSLERIMESANSNMSCVGQTPKGHSKKAHIPQMETVMNSVENLDYRFCIESSEQKLGEFGLESDAPDMFDVGFNTQMAAEAIEALAYAPLSLYCSDNTYQGPPKALEDSPNALTKNKADCGRLPVKKGSCLGLADFTKGSKQRMHTSKRARTGTLSKYQTHSEKEDLDAKLITATKLKKGKLSDQNHLRCRSSINQNDISCQRSPKSTKLRKARGALEKKESSISAEHTSLGKRNSIGDSPVAHRTRHSMWRDRLPRSKSKKDPMDYGVNMNGFMDIGGFKVRRKRSTLSRATEKYPILSLNSSPVLRNSKLSQQEQNGLESAITSTITKLVPWSHPRGKRTHRIMKNHLNGAGNNPYTPYAVVDGNQNAAQKKQLSVYNRRGVSEKNSEESMISKNLDASVSTDLVSYYSNSERTMASIRSSEPNPVDSMTLTDAAECVGATNCTEAMTVATNQRSFEYHKKPCNKNLPKSSLVKELIRLGVSEPMLSLTWKDSRRPRGTAYVRVLFSQHLGDDIIKQQKKILSRLGISVASCSTDATHFIADKFARTRNMLEAIVLGKPVVTHQWLESCRQAGYIIDEKQYILRDAKKEKEIGFSMPVTLARASQYPILKDKRVFITPSVKPDEEMITSLVKAACGQAVDRSQLSAAKDDDILDDLLILSCEEDHTICEPFLKKGAAVYSSELLLNGIVTQKFEYARHQLFTNNARKKCTRNMK